MYYFNFHTHQSAIEPNILELVNQYPHEFDTSIKYYSIGIHPWHIEESRIENDLKIIEEKLQLDNCLAVGECGLDKRIETPLALQIKVFENQLVLAQKYNKPVVIHCVAAFQEVVEIKKRLNITVPLIIHGFSKNEQVAQSLINSGFYISFGKYLLRNPELEKVFKTVPNDKFFLETDTIHEGIETVYGLASKYKNISRSALNEIIDENFQSVFKNKLSNYII